MIRCLARLTCLLLLTIAPLAAAQETTKARDATKPEAKRQLQATLLLIKGYWSEVPAAKEVTADLQAAVKDAAVPKDLVERLPESGPAILFAHRMVSYYRGEQFAEVLAWLKSRGLVEKELPFSIQEINEPTPGAEKGYIRAELNQPLDFVDLSEFPQFATQPFLERKVELLWKVNWLLPEPRLQVLRTLTLFEKRRGQTAFEVKEEPDQCYFALSGVPTGATAVTNAFPPDSDYLSRALSQKGLVGVLVLQTGPAPANAKNATPKIALPEEVNFFEPQHDVRLGRPTSRGRGSGGNMAPPGGGGMRIGNPFGGSSGARGGIAGSNPQPQPGAASSETASPAAASGLISTQVTDREQVDIYQLKHLRADELQMMLQELFDKTARVMADPRQQRIVVSTSSAADAAKIGKLIQQLDAPPANPPVAAGVDPQSAQEFVTVPLRHARADSLFMIIQQLLPPNARVIPDSDQQRLIVQGSAADRKTVSEIIARLDTPSETAFPGRAVNPVDPNVAGAMRTQSDASSLLQQLQEQLLRGNLIQQQAGPAAKDLARQYHVAEQEAQLAAQQWRTLTAKPLGDVKTTADIAAARARLQAAVVRAFESRQKLQQTELLEMQRRIYGLASTIEDREKIKEQIIERRVQELLNPALQWPAPAAANIPAASAHQSGVEGGYGANSPSAPTSARAGSLPNPLAADPTRLPATPTAGRTLSDAVREFNAENANKSLNRDQPLLTDDEVVAAIRWTTLDRKSLLASDDEIKTLLEIADSRKFPQEAQLRMASEMLPAGAAQVQRLSIRLELPSPRGKPYQHVLREVYVGFQVTASNGAPKPVTEEPDAVPLEAAVKAFNQRHLNDPVGKDQPLLNMLEVVSAIRAWGAMRDEAPVTDGEFAAFQAIAQTGKLPAKAEFEVLTSFQPNDQLLFTAWSVRIRMPRGQDGGSYAYTIRDRWLRVKKLKEREVAWGPVAKNGLQVGLWIDPPSPVLTKGQQVVPHFYFRNASGRDATISLPRLMTHGYYAALQATDDTGEKIEMEQDEGPGGPVGWIEMPFAAGAEHEVVGLPIAIGQVKRGPGVETVLCAVPGQQCRLRFSLSNYLERESKDVLQTGEVRFAAAEE